MKKKGPYSKPLRPHPSFPLAERLTASPREVSNVPRKNEPVDLGDFIGIANLTLNA